MTPLDDLPAEQRAVLELVLKRGRTYDEIAALLAIDRAGVRQRALAAFDALGPSTSVAPERRALITDYLLGQLPERVSEQVAHGLATQAGDRAWARVLASEIGSLASAPLPRIPTAADLDEAESGEEGSPPQALERSAPAGAGPAAARPGDDGRSASGGPGAEPPPRSSRLGGAILLGIGALVVVVVIVVLLLNGSSSKSPSTTSGAGSTPTTTLSSAASSPATTTATAATGTGTTGTTPQTLATVKLTAATAGSKAEGVAEAFNQSGTPYLALVAINLTPNSHNYYAVWLTNSPTDSRLLGFAPAVDKTGRLQAAGKLNRTDARYKQLVVTLETQPHPKTPGSTVLSGAFDLKSF